MLMGYGRPPPPGNGTFTCVTNNIGSVCGFTSTPSLSLSSFLSFLFPLFLFPLFLSFSSPLRVAHFSPSIFTSSMPMALAIAVVGWIYIYGYGSGYGCVY